MRNKGSIFADIRPLEEALNFSKQLQHPTKAPVERELFLDELKKSMDFDSAMKKATHKIVIRNEINHALKLNKIFSIVSEMIPQNIKNRIKRITGRQ